MIPCLTARGRWSRAGARSRSAFESFNCATMRPSRVNRSVNSSCRLRPRAERTKRDAMITLPISAHIVLFGALLPTLDGTAKPHAVRRLQAA